MTGSFEIIKSVDRVESIAPVRHVLVPAWCYRVVAPVQAARKLNHFQKACLGLCATGITHVNAISEHLGIEKDLAAYILVQLQNKSMLDEHGSLTRIGKETLEDLDFDYTDDEQLMDGYIFQDPWTERLYPWYEIELHRKLQDYDRKQNGRITIHAGSAGKPYSYSPFVIYPPSQYPQSIPSSLEMLSAIKAASQLRRQDPTSDRSHLLFRTSTDTKIALVSQEPLQVFLVTILYLPASSRTWLIRDPFGKRANPDLRSKLEEMRHQNTGMQSMLSKYEEFQGPDEKEKKMSDQSAGNNLEKDIKEFFGEHIESFGDIHELVMELWYSHSQWTDAGQFQRVNTRALLSTMGVLLEALFAVLNHDFKSNIDQLGTILSEDIEVNSTMLNEIAKKAGFRTPLPRLLSKISGSRLISEYVYAQGSSRPKAVIALMSGVYIEDNPLIHIAEHSPDFFDRVDGIAQLRDALQHYSGETPDQRDVSQAFNSLNHITKIILEVLNISTEQYKDNDNGEA